MAEHEQRFDTFEQWVNKASSWLTRHPRYNEHTFRATCMDSFGRVCSMGRDFERARDDGAFPVHWRWPGEPFPVNFGPVRMTMRSTSGGSVSPCEE